ncbi:MAG: response regulator [Rhodospirillales bacterium]|nr:response regulator [Rhodospirillales bacterium]
MNAPNQQADNKARVIVGVDDVPENLMLLKAYVVGAGYTFFGAPSGAECVDLVHRVTPKLILLDVQMPDMDGFETCRKLRGLTNTARVPIAFITVCKTAQDVRAGMAAGGNDFIVKPFTREHLLERIRFWVTKRLEPAAGPGGVWQ